MSPTPTIITAAGSITNSTSPILVDLLDITTFKSDGRTYAAVLSADFDVQILDVTYPPNIAVAGNITDNLDMSPSYRRPQRLYLCGATITTFESGDDIYAVAANIDASVQILKVTDPSDIAVAGNITTFALSWRTGHYHIQVRQPHIRSSYISRPPLAISVY